MPSGTFYSNPVPRMEYGGNTPINEVYSPELLHKCTKAFADLVFEYLKLSQDEKVSFGQYLSPQEITEKACRALSKDLSCINDGKLKNTDDIITRFKILATEAFCYSRRLYAEHYMGHQVGPPVPVSTLFDCIGSLTNQSAAIFEMGPYTSAVEKALSYELCRTVGWPNNTGAVIFTNGGSLANLTAMLAARSQHFKSVWKKGSYNSTNNRIPSIICSKDVHYSMSRAAGILGIGTDNLISCPLDDKRRMDVKALKALLDQSPNNNRDIFCIVASAGTTSIGAFDPIEDIADLCQKHNIWLHVDGAHGASLLLSDKYKDLVQGIKNADSIVWDAHKMLFVPSTSTMLLYKNVAHSYEVFSQEAPYLFDKKANPTTEYDGALRTVECTKHSNAYSLWGVWAMFGPQFLGTLIDTCIQNAKSLYEILEDCPDFEILHKPQCNILCFKHIPVSLKHQNEETISVFQKRLREKIVKDGRFYITGTQWDGSYVLRVTLMNPLIENEHLQNLIQHIRDMGLALSS